MNYVELIGLLSGIGTLVLIIIGLSKFFAQLARNKEEIKNIKDNLQKINFRLVNIENEHIRISSYFDSLKPTLFITLLVYASTTNIGFLAEYKIIESAVSGPIPFTESNCCLNF